MISRLKIFFVAILIWAGFICLAPIQIQNGSQVDSLVRVAEPYNNSPEFSLNSSAPLLLSILSGRLTYTPDAGATIGISSLSFESMARLQQRFWDPFTGSGRPMDPFDGYTTGVSDPIQYIAAVLFSKDPVRALGLIAVSNYLLLIFFLLYFFIRHLDLPPILGTVGALIFLSSRHLHYAPNHLIYLGVYVVVGACLNLIGSLISRNTSKRERTFWVLITALLLSNHLSLGFLPFVILFGTAGAIAICNSFRNIKSREIIAWMLSGITVSIVCIPRLLLLRQTAADSTNPLFPYLPETIALRQGVQELIATLPYGQSLFGLFFWLAVLVLGLFSLWPKYREISLFGFLLLITSVCISSGVFSIPLLKIGLNIQEPNVYGPLITLLASISLPASFLLVFNRFSRTKIAVSLEKKRFQLVSQVLLVIFAVGFSPFNNLERLIGLDYFIITGIAVTIGVVAVLLNWNHPKLKMQYVNQGPYLFSQTVILALVIFLFPITNQFYGREFTTSAASHPLPEEVLSLKNKSNGLYRFVMLHGSADGMPSALTNDNANEFLYYPSTASLHRMYEVAGGLSLNNLQYSNFLDSINLGVGLSDPSHPASSEFQEQIKKMNAGEIPWTPSAQITAQNKRNNLLISNPNSPLLRFTAARYIVSSFVPSSTEGLTEVAVVHNYMNAGRDMSLKIRVPNFYVYEIDNYLPRAYFASEIVQKRSDLVIDELLRTRTKGIAIVEGHLSKIGKVVDPGLILSLRDSANQTSITVKANNDSFLVLSDVFHSNWKATIDGKPVAIHRTNYSFRGVEVPKGEHVIVFSFGSRLIDVYFLMVFVYWILMAANLFGVSRVRGIKVT